MSPWQLHGNLHRMFTTSSASASASAIITSFLRDLSNERDLDRLVHSFKQASQSDRFRSKHRIYARTVRRLALAKRFQSIEDILEHQKTFKDISKEGFSARLITLYGKSGMVQNAHKVFDEMPQRNCPRTVLSLNALLASYLHSNVFDMVPTLFNHLPTQLSVEPNLVTYNTVIKAFCEMGSFDSASSMLDDLELKGVKPDVITFNTLLDGLYSNGRFEDGEKIWKRMEDEHVAPDVQSYNAKIVGMCVEKRSGDAVMWYQKMRSEEGVKPNLFSINALIRGFVNEDNLDEAKKWFSEIATTEFAPDRHTFNILLPFLCDKGDLKAAFEVSKEIFNGRCFVGPPRSLLQLVVDTLLNNSMILEAKEIAKLADTSSKPRYELNLPQDL
ncbi:pentatricopeptide repeat-containing protein At1g55890, mitochondrial-like [Arachis stenosperma]|uniref:pentatricopeptide repeat-containing protein At1g55890, mitochondrial-like n=1 Tax=Arachis stenosperma TaxID=217475 RepID=UPI0025AC2A8B|nr:pentatricopeptide repeat-containing protein At1g55890, mitochondrial-like [Arachis stenosperma]